MQSRIFTKVYNMGQFFSSNIPNVDCQSDEYVSEETAMDILGKLPPEIASMILRKLDGPTLATASLVNKRWFFLCRGDHVTQKQIDIHLCHLSKCLNCQSAKLRSSTFHILNGKNITLVRSRAWFTFPRTFLGQ